MYVAILERQFLDRRSTITTAGHENGQTKCHKSYWVEAVTKPQTIFYHGQMSRVDLVEGMFGGLVVWGQIIWSSAAQHRLRRTTKLPYSSFKHDGNKDDAKRINSFQYVKHKKDETKLLPYAACPP